MVAFAVDSSVDPPFEAGAAHRRQWQRATDGDVGFGLHRRVLAPAPWRYAMARVGAVAGKEHAAMELHRRAQRRGPLVRFNVAVVSQNLFESELFGHVAGTFTGAGGARSGRIREAHNGTLVLDEIGELPEAMQPKLLRLLEEAKVRTVGGNADVTVDVGFIASTNADLDQLVRTGRFRRDLLARLRGNVVPLPRVADRLPDLLDLADAVARADKPWRDRLAADAVESLLLHGWPDNLRELRSVLSRAQLLAGTSVVGPRHLPETLRARMEPPLAEATPPGMVHDRPSAVQLRAWLREHGGNIDAVARHVNRHRRQIYRSLQDAGLGPEEIEASRTREDPAGRVKRLD